MNRIDLQALTLVGLTATRPVLDPLAIIHLDNRLYIINVTHILLFKDGSLAEHQITSDENMKKNVGLTPGSF